jgi:DNA-binding HxlR family transcriptional regulator
VKGKRKSFAADACPVARSVDAFGDWWSLLIIRDAFAGKRRFGDFQQSLGLAKNILTSRLHKLVAQGILRTAPASDGSAYREYALTDRGKSLHPVLIAIWQWGEASLFAPGEIQGILCDRENGEPIPRMELRASDGRVLKAGDTMIRLLPRIASRRQNRLRRRRKSIEVRARSGTR